jgi:hypothetical protein
MTHLLAFASSRETCQSTSGVSYGAGKPHAPTPHNHH